MTPGNVHLRDSREAVRIIFDVNIVHWIRTLINKYTCLSNLDFQISIDVANIYNVDFVNYKFETKESIPTIKELC